MPRLRRRGLGVVKGFTLLEVIAALAIFAITATILLSAIGNSYAIQSDFLDRDTRQEDRREILRNVLALSATDSTKLDSGGSYRTDSGADVNWSADVEETAQAGLFRLILEIDWGDSEKPEMLIFYTFRPGWKSQFNAQNTLIEDMRDAFPSDRFDSY